MDDRDAAKRAWFRSREIEAPDALADADGDADDFEIESLAEDYEISDLRDVEFVNSEVRRLRSSAERMGDRTPEYAEEQRNLADSLEFAAQLARYRSDDSIESLATHAKLVNRDE